MLKLPAFVRSGGGQPSGICPPHYLSPAMFRRALLLLLLPACTTPSADDFAGFAPKSPTRYNRLIAAGRARQQPWVRTPRRIISHLLGPELHAEPYPFTYQQLPLPDSSCTVTVTQERLPDDSVYGEKTVFRFAFWHGCWIITSLKVGYRCQYGRGYDDYSGVWCN